MWSELKLSTLGRLKFLWLVYLYFLVLVCFLDSLTIQAILDTEDFKIRQEQENFSMKNMQISDD